MKTKIIALVVIGYVAAVACGGGWAPVLALLVLLAILGAFYALFGWLLAKLLEWIDRSDMPADTTGEDQP